MSALLYCQITFLHQKSTRSTSMMILISAARSFIRFMTTLLEATPESLTHGVLLIADTKDPVYTNSLKAISMDLITDLPRSNRYDAILTIVDQGCSKAAKFLPCNKTIDGQGVAQLYFW